MDLQLAEMIQGYAKANDFIEQERMRRLGSMTSEQSRIIYNELVTSWDRVAENEVGLERLDAWRLETTLSVRKAFSAMAEEYADI